jgi:hypothetical protein
MESLWNYLTAQKDSVLGILVLGIASSLIVTVTHLALKRASKRYAVKIESIYYRHGYLMGLWNNNPETVGIVAYFTVQLSWIILLAMGVFVGLGLAVLLGIAGEESSLWAALPLALGILSALALRHRLNFIYFPLDSLVKELEGKVRPNSVRQPQNKPVTSKRKNRQRSGS